MPEPKDITTEARTKLNGATQQQADILAREIVTTYIAGYSKAGATAPLTDLQQDAIAEYTEEQTGYIAEYNEAIGDQIEQKVTEDVAKGMTYDEIKQDVKPYVEEVFTTGTVEIDRTGETKEVVHVDSDGNLYRETEVISKPYSATTETYSETLAHTAKHTIYEKGRAEGYQSLGITKWRFSGPVDERTRPEHAAIVGNIYEYGTAQSDMAESLLTQVNCRHRATPVVED